MSFGKSELNFAAFGMSYCVLALEARCEPDRWLKAWAYANVIEGDPLLHWTDPSGEIWVYY